MTGVTKVKILAKAGQLNIRSLKRLNINQRTTLIKLSKLRRLKIVIAFIFILLVKYLVGFF